MYTRQLTRAAIFPTSSDRGNDGQRGQKSCGNQRTWAENTAWVRGLRSSRPRVYFEFNTSHFIDLSSSLLLFDHFLMARRALASYWPLAQDENDEPNSVCTSHPTLVRSTQHRERLSTCTWILIIQSLNLAFMTAILWAFLRAPCQKFPMDEDSCEPPDIPRSLKHSHRSRCQAECVQHSHHLHLQPRRSSGVCGERSLLACQHAS